MRIALIGAAGQLGTDLKRILPDVVPITHHDLELTDSAQVAGVLDRILPDLVLNTAAYNLVDAAEDQPDLARAVNVVGPENLARWCSSRDVTLVQISSDYVFGGDSLRQTPYTEEDEPAPLGVYGRSKLDGENVVRTLCERHFVIRTCGLYGQAETRSKGNFVKTMLRLADERPELNVVNDQHCTPSYTADVAEMIAALIQQSEYGTYHITNSGATTWFEVAREALRLAGKSTLVHPIPSSAYPTKAQRPAYSVLDCRKVQLATGLSMPTWQNALARYVATLQERPSASA